MILEHSGVTHLKEHFEEFLVSTASLMRILGDLTSAMAVAEIATIADSSRMVPHISVRPTRTVTPCRLPQVESLESWVRHSPSRTETSSHRIVQVFASLFSFPKALSLTINTSAKLSNCTSFFIQLLSPFQSSWSLLPLSTTGASHAIPHPVVVPL